MRSTTVLTVPDSVFTSGAPASTVTISVRAPSVISKSMLSASWTWRITSGLIVFLKPGFSTSMRYGPGAEICQPVFARAVGVGCV